jgi:hypothetical protein
LVSHQFGTVIFPGVSGDLLLHFRNIDKKRQDAMGGIRGFAGALSKIGGVCGGSVWFSPLGTRIASNVMEHGVGASCEGQ